MKENVETEKVIEATAAEETKKQKYPTYDIQRLTKAQGIPPTREIIKMHATSETTYDKYYIPASINNDGSPKPIRRTKQVHLPVSINGKKFDTTTALWEELLASGDYSRAPKQARRDKIKTR